VRAFVDVDGPSVGCFEAAQAPTLPEYQRETRHGRKGTPRALARSDLAVWNTNKPKTPLHITADHWRLEVIRLFLGHGGDT
jgi:hypothetical protein